MAAAAEVGNSRKKVKVGAARHESGQTVREGAVRRWRRQSIPTVRQQLS